MGGAFGAGFTQGLSGGLANSLQLKEQIRARREDLALKKQLADLEAKGFDLKLQEASRKLQSGETLAGLLGTLPAQPGEIPPAGPAAEFEVGTPVETQSLRRSLLANLARQDPEKALKVAGDTFPGLLGPEPTVTLSPGQAVVGKSSGTVQTSLPPKPDQPTIPAIVLQAAGGDPQKAIEILTKLRQSERGAFFTIPGFDVEANAAFRFNARTGELEKIPVPGGGPITTKAQRPTGFERTAVAGRGSILDRLDQVEADLADAGQFLGPVKGRVGRIADLFPRTANAERAAFFSRVQQINTEARHDLFGATLTEGENQAFQQIALDPNLPPDVFAARLQAMRAQLVAKQAATAREQAATATVRVAPPQGPAGAPGKVRTPVQPPNILGIRRVR